MGDRKCLGILFSNMHDDSIQQLTQHRTMGSVPFGGRYRFIDFPLSNFVNSGIGEVGVITKMNYQSLMDHLGSGVEWELARKREGLYILPPYGEAGSVIYKGRIQALQNIISVIERSTARYVVLADCGVIANIDVRKIVESHIERGADITAAYKKRDLQNLVTRDSVVFQFDEEQRVTDVQINPVRPDESYSNACMNLFVMEKEFLLRLIRDCTSRSQYSFKRDVLQAKFKTLRIFGFEIEGFCIKIDSMMGYFNANMMLLEKKNRDDLFNKEAPIYTKVRDEVSAKYGLNAKVSNSLLADGCIIEGEVENSILFRGVKIAKGAKVQNSIVMQGTHIGEDANLNYVITDKDVTVGEKRMLMGFSSYPIFISKGSIV